MKPGRRLPDWAHWNADPARPAWTVGIEEEVMLLDPRDWELADRIDDLLPELEGELAGSVAAETHACTLELATEVHSSVRGARDELLALRGTLDARLRALGLRAAVAGTHPFAPTKRTQVSGGARYQVLEHGLRDLARREPTFALHVHVGVPSPDLAVAAADRLRAHLPLILALSANSPFWGGRDSGMASVRTPLFQAFPRSGMPRRFHTYEAYAQAVDTLMLADAIPEPTFLWWDVRLQPRFGTVEVRIADAQTSVDEAAALAALIQVLVRIEATERLAPEALVDAPEVLEENRFLAVRDGVEACMVDPLTYSRVPVAELLDQVLAVGRGHARDLTCGPELERARGLLATPGSGRQRELAREHGPEGMVAALADLFLASEAPLNPAAAGAPRSPSGEPRTRPA